MRLFVAIELSDHVRQRIREVQARLMEMKADVRWVPPENMHITVKFLGDVEEARVAELLQRVQKAAAQTPAFELEIEGVDRLPERGPVRVIMSRVLSRDQRITRLHNLLDSAAGGMGLPMDTRVLVPHLTLGRVSSNHGLNKLLRMVEKHDLDFFGAVPVERAVLFQSVPGAGENGAPRYVVVGAGTLSPTERVAGAKGTGNP